MRAHLVTVSTTFALLACSARVEVASEPALTAGLPSEEPAALTTARRLAPASIASFLAETTEGIRRSDGALGTPAERARDAAFDGVGAVLPEAVDQTFSVGLSRLRRFRAALTFDGAGTSRAQLHAGRVLYADAYRDTDLIVVAGHARLESLFLVRTAAAPHAWSMTIGLPEGIADVRDEPGAQRLVLLDRASEPVLYVPYPFAVDAQGVRREIVLETSRPSSRELRLSMRLDRAGLAYPLLVDPAIESSAWTGIAGTGSSGHYDYAMAYDADRKVIVQYGGSQPAVAGVGETWEYGATKLWTKRCGPCAPGPRDGAGLAYDVVRKRMVLAMGPSSNQTWGWNGVTWTSITTSDVARSRYALAADPTGTAFLWGGARSGGSAGVSLDASNTWGSSLPFSRPSDRAGSAMVWDSKRSVYVLFSGSNGAADTWTVTQAGGNWSDKSTSLSPAARADYGLAFDSVRGKAVLFGGTVDNKTWEWDGAAWRETTPSSSPTIRSRVKLAFATEWRRTVMFGGKDSAFGSFGDTFEYHARGGACTTATECDTGSCVDGVCCEQTACGSCEACDTAARPGECAKVMSADDPDSCAIATSTCDAAGACKKRIAQVCAASSECASGACVDGVCCGAACGVCESCAINPGTCTAITNAPDADTCSGNKSCDASGACKANLGGACADAASCASNLCVDGVCCETACGAQCEACNVVGSEGKCAAISGTPRGARAACKGIGGACGGTCDGKRRDGCTYPDLTTKCGSRCAGATYAESLCDGSGACLEQTPKTCLGGFQCDAEGACLTKCAKPTDCAGGLVCGSDGLCVPNSATCDGEHTTTDSSGKTSDCTPFRCESAGTCKSSCASSDDCVAPRLCESSGACVLPATSEEEGGCAMSRATGRRESGARGMAALGLAALAAIYGRRRLSSRRTS